MKIPICTLCQIQIHDCRLLDNFKTGIARHINTSCHMQLADFAFKIRNEPEKDKMLKEYRDFIFNQIIFVETPTEVQKNNVMTDKEMVEIIFKEMNQNMGPYDKSI